MSFIYITFFVICPIAGTIFTLLLYFFDRSKYGTIYSIILGLSFGIMAYNFIPRSTYDLVRHQNVVLELMKLNGTEIIRYLVSLDLELLPKLYSFIISLTRNVNLLQFFIVSTGYSVLFYMMYDYNKKLKLKPIFFIPIVLYVIFGFNILYFFSGLYCYIAIIIFSLSFYFEYEKKYNKKLCYVLYALALLFHNSLFFPIIVLVIFKIFKEKLSFKLITISVLSIVLSNLVLEFLHLHVNIDLIQKIYSMFYAYTERNEIFVQFYSGYIFIIEILKLLFTLFNIIFLRKFCKKNSKIYSFILLLDIMTALMMTKSIVMIRFIMLIQFIGIIPLFDIFACCKRSRVIIYVIMIILMIFYGGYFIHVILKMDFGNFFSEQFFKPIFFLF